MMMKKTNVSHAQSGPFVGFVDMSSAFTGYNVTELWGTGLPEFYWDMLKGILSEAFLEEMGGVYLAIKAEYGGDPAKFEEEVRAQLFESPRWGPISRNLIQLWYVGTWNQLDAEWCKSYGDGCHDCMRDTYIPSGDAYVEGLAWDAIGAHPMAGKEVGFGAWSFPPPTHSGSSF